MNRVRLLKLLLSPSLSSGLIVLITVTVTLSLVAWTYIAHEQLFYDYLFGRYGLTTILLIAPDSFGFFRGAIINSLLTYYAIVTVAAIIVTLVIYTILESFERVGSGTRSLWQEIESDDKVSKELLKETSVKLVLRCLSLIGWMCYILLFVKMLIPLSIALLQSGLDGLATNTIMVGVASIVGAWLLLLVGSHMHVTFARLCLLKVRVFGNLQ